MFHWAIFPGSVHGSTVPRYINVDINYPALEILMLKIASLIFTVLLTTVVSAGERTIAGRVESVDTAKNTVTVRNDDVDESKTLDVAKKTEITLDGKKATLAALKKDQFIELTFDEKLEIASSIDANNELTPAALSAFNEKRLAVLRQKIQGCYAVGLSCTKGRQDFFVNIKSDTTVRWDGQHIGTWSSIGDKLNLTLLQPQVQGSVRFIKDNLIGTVSDAQKQDWRIECKRLNSTRWDFEGPTGRRIVTLWSNGRIDMPDSKAKWVKVGNKIDLHWHNGFVDSCKFSADGRRFEGRNRKNELISGKRVD